MVKKIARFAIGLVAGLALIAGAHTASATLYYGSGENAPNFGTIDLAGNLNVINAPGGSGFRGITYRPSSGQLFASIRSFAAGGAEAIVTVDLGTGVATTLVTDIGPGMRAMAYDPTTDRIYVAPGGLGGSAGNRLGWLDNLSTTPTLTDSQGNFSAAVDALAIDPNNGTLYGTMDNGDSTDNLITIDKTDGTNITLVQNLGIPHVGSLTYRNGEFIATVDNAGADPNDGGLFGGKSLYSISLDGLTVTQLNADVGDWVKVEFVPEPGTIGLLAVGLAVLRIRRRRQG